MPKQFVLLTETPPQPNLLFPAGAALKCTPSSSSSISLPLLSSSSPFAPPPFWVCATSSALSAPPHLLCSLSCVFPASDGSIHEKCDVSRSSSSWWLCRPPTHSPGAAGVRGMSVIFHPLPSPSLLFFYYYFFPFFWIPTVSSVFLSPGFFPPSTHPCLSWERTMNLSRVCCE